MFIMKDDAPLDAAAMHELINLHRRERNEFERLRNQYMSKPPLLRQPPKEKYKPDNRLVVNFGKYLIDTFNGYFIGIPTKVYHPEPEINKPLQRFWKTNDMDDVISELAKLTSLYGKAYLFVYQDEDAQTRVAYNDPFDMFVVYSKKIKPAALYGVRYTRAKDGAYEGQVYERDRWYNFRLLGNSYQTFAPKDEPGGGALYYDRMPIIEFMDNEERQSLIKPVESMINAYNKAISEKANDVDYFADAYLSILGAELDEKTLQGLRDNRIINLSGDVDMSKIIVQFLSKPSGDATQENLLDRLEELVYTISMVTNLNDASSGIPSSAEALRIKQQPMALVARTKERKFQSGLQTLFKMFFNLPTNVDAANSTDYIDLEYKWTKNTINNEKDEVDIARGLEGIVSKSTQLAQLSIVDDVNVEMEKIANEKEILENSTTPTSE